MHRGPRLSRRGRIRRQSPNEHRAPRSAPRPVLGRSPSPDGPRRAYSSLSASTSFSGVLAGHNGELASVFSYDQRTDRWKSESPLPPLGNCRVRSGLRTVAHEGLVATIGTAASPLALVNSVWTEQSPFPQTIRLRRRRRRAPRVYGLTSVHLVFPRQRPSELLE